MMHLKERLQEYSFLMRTRAKILRATQILQLIRSTWCWTIFIPHHLPQQNHLNLSKRLKQRGYWTWAFLNTALVALLALGPTIKILEKVTCRMKIRVARKYLAQVSKKKIDMYCCQTMKPRLMRKKF